MKVVKCLLLDVDNVIISQVEEVGADIGEPDCKLIKPYLFESIDNMKPWPKATDQTELMIRSISVNFSISKRIASCSYPNETLSQFFNDFKNVSKQNNKLD